MKQHGQSEHSEAAADASQELRSPSGRSIRSSRTLPSGRIIYRLDESRQAMILQRVGEQEAQSVHFADEPASTAEAEQEPK